MNPAAEKIRSLEDVVAWRLCAGCGACAYAMPAGSVKLGNFENDGIRPVFRCRDESGGRDLSYCPGYRVEDPRPKESEYDREYGPVLEVWEGHASDPEVRRRASSGGLLTALAVHCLEQEGMESVVHSAMDESQPWLNKTVASRSRDELVRRAGSRYAPSSPCEGLGWIEQGTRANVFIGKPCDAAAVSALCRQRPELNARIGVVLTFFCAGTPSTRGTLSLLESFDAAPQEIESIRYRGEGWPGGFHVRFKDGREELRMSYEQSWGRLTHYRPLRCNLCADGLGRIADLSCGDAWHRYSGDGDPGRSIVLVRTERGREILHRAMRSGCVELKECAQRDVLKAQANLLERRRQLKGRFLAMRCLGIPYPQFDGFSLDEAWRRMPFPVRLKSFFGTIRRMIRDNCYRRRILSNPA